MRIGLPVRRTSSPMFTVRSAFASAGTPLGATACRNSEVNGSLLASALMCSVPPVISTISTWSLIAIVWLA